MELLSKGFNVAIVFKLSKGGKLPTTYKGYKVINGDETDLRFLDDKNVIVGLKYKNNTGKGGAEKNKLAVDSGFVIDLSKKVLKAKYSIKVNELV
jgi:hypothetical protein